MRLAKKSLAVAVVLLANGMRSQEVYHSQEADVFARLSYDNSAAVHEEGVRHICLSVSADGNYRIVRKFDSGMTERRQGKIPAEQFQKLKNDLLSSDFKALSGNGGGLIRQESERFAAEILKPGHHDAANKTRKLQWLNADGENPFPKPVAKVVEWLKQFQPKSGKAFTYAEYPDVCPSGGLRLLQPSVATNERP